MRETGKINVVDWYKDPETYFQMVIVSIIILIFIIFTFVDMALWQAVWVFINIAFGYAVIGKLEIRKKVREIYLGLKEPKVWGIAILNLMLVLIASFMISVLSTSSGGSEGGNPFVSNLFLVITLIPIMPLFADAETKIFQGLLIKLFTRRSLTECNECSIKGIPKTPCTKCGKVLEGERPIGPMLWIGIGLSAAVFAAAHMLLLWSLFPAVLFIGGMVLGICYVRKGHIFTAKVHFIYNMILLSLLILFFSITALGVGI